ncbi:RNA-directed DNA polymerase, eukaryota [Tanacetum coccineum]
MSGVAPRMDKREVPPSTAGGSGGDRLKKKRKAIQDTVFEGGEIISINVRGMGNSEKRGWIRSIIRNEQPDVIGLQETKSGVVDDTWIEDLWGGKVKGLWKGKVDEVFLVCIYGPHVTSQKENLWNRISAQPVVHQDDLKLVEDFVERTIDEVFLALGCHLEEIHVTWAHLEKKHTRLRLSTKSFGEIMHTERGDGVARRKLVETTFHELWLCQVKFGLISLDSHLHIFNLLLDHNPADIHRKSNDDDIK